MLYFELSTLASGGEQREAHIGAPERTKATDFGWNLSGGTRRRPPPASKLDTICTICEVDVCATDGTA
jgi:hypothetical protein